MHIPSVQRISPKLSCCRKSIWRTSGYLCRLVIFIQFEKSWICPGICAVHGNIDRNISDNTNSSSVCIRFQFRPLFIKFELHILLEFNFKIQFFSVIIQCIVPAKANVLRPFCPRNSSKTILHRHKKCIIAKPVRLLLLEYGIVRIGDDGIGGSGTGHGIAHGTSSSEKGRTGRTWRRFERAASDTPFEKHAVVL